MQSIRWGWILIGGFFAELAIIPLSIELVDPSSVLWGNRIRRRSRADVNLAVTQVRWVGTLLHSQEHNPASSLQLDQFDLEQGNRLDRRDDLVRDPILKAFRIILDGTFVRDQKLLDVFLGLVRLQ